MTPRTIVDVLAARADAHPDRLLYRFLPTGEVDEPGVETWTYADAFRRSLAVAEALTARGLAGRPVLLLYAPGLPFAAAFFGALAAGAMAVPAYPPDPADMARTLSRLVAIVDDAGAAAVLTTEGIAAMRDALADGAPRLHALPWIATDALDPAAAAGFRRADVDPESVAFLQYTSGSTGTPRGVMLRHRNVLHNAAIIQRAMQAGESTHVVSWLPQYHDMGLMSALVEVLFVGGSSTMMSPLDFLRRPMRWLEAASRYRGTHCGGPNFAFDLCARKADDAAVARLDLSSWRVAWNGAEPVRADTLRRFAARFAPAGFQPDALLPCYGLAESTVGVTFVAVGDPVLVVGAARDALERGRLHPADPDAAERAVELVGCGRPDGVELAIVDPDAHVERGPGEVGEIWVRSDSVGAGYWNRPDETAATFEARLARGGRGPFLRTGDLGVMHEGQLFVTGRLKDLVIVRGRNHAPSDLERTVEGAHPRVRPGCAAAFDAEGTSGRLAVVAEVTGGIEGLDEVARAVRAAVLKRHEIVAEEVALVAPRAVPKTSSGKVQRRECRRRLRDGELSPLLHARPAKASETRRPPARKPVPAGQVAVVAHLAAAIGKVTGASVAGLDAHAPLDGLGLDSLAVVELKARIEEDLGVAVPLSVLREASTLGEVAAWLERESDDGRSRSSRVPDAPPSGDPWSDHVNPHVARLLRAFELDRRYVRAEGCYVEDDAGRRYLDFTAAYGALPFGFNPPAIWDAVREASVAMPATLVQPSLLDAAGRLARRLVEIAPPGLRHVTFANSGAEAMEAAIKLARAATGRLGVVSMERGFHGKTLGALSATGRAAHQGPFGAPAPGFVRAPFGDLDALAAVLAHEAGGVAAVVVEPVQGEGGIHVAPPGYLRGVRELCDRHGVLLVADEVQTGLGRTGAMFACEHDGVVPDVIALAKALGGGLVPIGAVLCNDAAYSEVFALRHSSTFAGNALASLVGLRTIELLTADDRALVRHVAAEGEALGEGLRALQRRFPRLVREVRGRGFMYGVELTDDHAAFDGQCLMGAMAGREGLALGLCSYLLNVEGVRLAPTLLGTRVLRVEPPLVATRAECERFVAALDRALGLLERCDTAGFFGHLVGRPPTARAPASVRPPRPVARPDDARWGFVFHPLDLASYVDFDPGLAAFDRGALGRLVSRLDDVPRADGGHAMVIGAGRVASPAGASAYGELVAIPATADELLAMPSAEAVERVREAVALARDRGARVVGLGAYTSIVTRNAAWLPDLGVPVTTGNSFTVVAALDLVLRAARSRGVPLGRATVAIVGATGAIGRALALELGPTVGALLLCGNPAHPEKSRERLARVAEDVVAHLAGRPPAGAQGLLAARVLGSAGEAPSALAARLVRAGVIALDASAAPDLGGAAVVVAATSSTGSLVAPGQLGPGAVVCDVSRPGNVSPRVAAERPDVLLVEGGVVALPDRAELGVRFGLAPGLLYACMAETVLLALERRFHHGTVGADLSTDRIADLRELAARHGFSAVPSQGGRALSDEEWGRLTAPRR